MRSWTLFGLALFALGVTFGAGFVSAQQDAAPADTQAVVEPVEPVAAPSSSLCIQPAADAQLLAAAGDCLRNEDCKDDCPLGGRCDAGSCLCDDSPLAITVIGECEDDDDCDCPNGGRCEKYHCLCYGA